MKIEQRRENGEGEELNAENREQKTEKLEKKKMKNGEKPLIGLPERTFTFAVRVVKLCKYLDETPGVSRTLARQLLRSATSIGANIEEGQASQSEADFLTKYCIAGKEARETHYWLRLLAETEVIPEDQLNELISEANELVAILMASIKTLKSKRSSKTR